MRFFDYKEQKTHGTIEFPLEYYCVNPYHERYIMPKHWHLESELIVVIKGELLVTVNNERFVLTKQKMLFINSGHMHNALPTEGCIYECLVFDPFQLLHKDKTVNQLIALFNGQYQIESFIDLSLHLKLKFFCNELFETLRNKKHNYKLITQCYIILLLNLLVECKQIKPIPKTLKWCFNLERFHKAITFIEDHYQQPLTLSAIAYEVGMSSKAFSTFFRLISNKTVIDYLNSYRVECACQQLLEHKKTLVNIALDCGFNSESYFIKIFKKVKQVTPHQWSEEG